MKVVRLGSTCLLLLLDYVLIRDRVKPIVDRGKVKQVRGVIRPQHQEGCRVRQLFTLEVAHQLVHKDAALTPSVLNRFGLARMDMREQIR